MNHVIVGYGQIGQAIHKIIGPANIVDIEKGFLQYGDKSTDILHVCFPFTHEFEDELKRYIDVFEPLHVIIYSTVPIGTSKKFSAVHSPVEGRHPNLEESIRKMERWIGTNNPRRGQFFKDFFNELGIRARVVKRSEYTEALKLLSTSEFGANLVFTDYKARVAEAIGMDFELTKDWNKEYNDLYEHLGLGETIKKYVLDPPKGHIGGHCVVPNAELLDEQFPSDILKKIKEYK